jgi:hypothetical protein
MLGARETAVKRTANALSIGSLLKCASAVLPTESEIILDKFAVLD